MSPLFRKSKRGLAQESAARMEFERLNALPVADLAAEVMPAFDPAARRPAHSIVGACLWLMGSCPHGTAYLIYLKRPVLEAIQALEHAGLLISRVRSGGAGTTTQSIVTITRLGETALAEGSVQRHLQPAAQLV